MAKNSSNEKVQGAFPTFDPATMTDQVREMTEKSVEQSRKAYETIKENVETVQKAVEKSLESVRTTGNEFSSRTISAFRANTEAGFDYLEALSRVTSMSQLVELQSSFMRRQSEASLDQFKEVQAAATKVTEDVFKPFKDVYARTLGNVA